MVFLQAYSKAAVPSSRNETKRRKCGIEIVEDQGHKHAGRRCCCSITTRQPLLRVRFQPINYDIRVASRKNLNEAVIDARDLDISLNYLHSLHSSSMEKTVYGKRQDLKKD
jgi:hypothetical protein